MELSQDNRRSTWDGIWTSVNDIEVNYHRVFEPGSWAHVYWGAATTNNALHEFHDHAAVDNIAAPPLGLDFYLWHGQSLSL